MSEKVYIKGQNHDTAVLLLAAAEELDQNVSLVRTVDGGFSVPADIADKAGFDADGNPKKAAAKKAAASAPSGDEQPKATRRRAPRKTAAKKATAKSSSKE